MSDLLSYGLSDHRRTRRTHKKSRNGCRNCKQRRVKCDEVKPTCGNCERFSIPCDTTPISAVSDRCEALANVPVPTARKRGRPRKDWSALTRNPDVDGQAPEASETAVSSPASSIREDITSQNLSYDDLELLHHYMSHQDFSQGNTLLWQQKVPRLAFAHHCVLHLLLAASAFHLLRAEPDRAERLERLADKHLSIGVRQATGIFPELSRDNCSVLYVAASLACCCGFAKKPGPRNLLVIADGNEVSWLDLLRGVRLIIETIGFEHVFTGILGPDPPPPYGERLPPDSLLLEYADWEAPLQKVATLIPTTAPTKDLYESTFHDLSWCFQETYGTSDSHKDAIIGQFQVVIRWLYALDDGFVTCLRESQPIALIILAYFSVLLSTLEYCWFVRGWATHVIRGIADILGSEYELWLQWPREQIEKTLKVTRPDLDASS
ncbi:uncharacterized protein F4822DRAFT_208089 [Hypoxylon trugodes]|uniref:uncharacterized protein n=1 Tax=Hypoxylon trugodes TaxID=326681 RepID=UPI00218C9312|nr:uncharacterized protein F4822DRAFT_208089 [Hypoxylon trugodes]KAI1389667.1 hypothetical protein F4822DRAFT_208089 [Hypoxylon trugodes]